MEKPPEPDWGLFLFMTLEEGRCLSQREEPEKKGSQGRDMSIR